MAAFLRGKQAGIQNDLSAGILPGLFAPDDQARFGINSQIGYEAPGAYGNSKLTTVSKQMLSIRSSSVPPCDRNQRNYFWQWSDLRLWPKTSTGYFDITPPSFCKGAPILRRPSSQCRLKERIVNMGSANTKESGCILSTWGSDESGYGPYAGLGFHRVTKWGNYCLRSG